jgi:type I restriction enzyme, R subunit
MSGARTLPQNVHVDAVRDDLDKVVLDSELLEAVLGTPDPKKAKEIEIKISKRLRQNQGNPVYKKLSERLEALKERHKPFHCANGRFIR